MNHLEKDGKVFGARLRYLWRATVAGRTPFEGFSFAPQVLKVQGDFVNWEITVQHVPQPQAPKACRDAKGKHHCDSDGKSRMGAFINHPSTGGIPPWVREVQ